MVKIVSRFISFAVVLGAFTTAAYATNSSKSIPAKKQETAKKPELVITGEIKLPVLHGDEGSFSEASDPNQGGHGDFEGFKRGWDDHGWGHHEWKPHGWDNGGCTPAVPEPGTAALALAGIGALGLIARRKQANKA